MHDDDKLKLAREVVKRTLRAKSLAASEELLKELDAGSYDSEMAVQSALAAINALDPQLVEAVGLLREIEAQFRFYGDNHAAKPDPVKAKTNYDWADRISAFLAKQGDV